VAFGVTGHTIVRFCSDGRLAISVDGVDSIYRRLDGEVTDTHAMLRLAVGHYVSADAGVAADLEIMGEDYIFTTRGPHGGRTSSLIPMPGLLAEIAWAVPATRQHGVVRFESSEGRVTRLWIDTERTRSLQFTRVERSGETPAGAAELPK